MTQYRALDLFCGAGGASMGLHRAGFDVTGIDIVRQKRYPFRFIQGDALRPPVRLKDFDLVWASPPCQAFSVLSAMHPDRAHPNLLPETRALLRGTLAWVIENVPTAPLAGGNMLDGTFGVTLCGSMFCLGVERGQLRRHRKFESNFPVGQPMCRHKGKAVGVYGHGGQTGKHRMLYREEAAEAMEMPWSCRDGMSQAVPPAYAEHIGRYAIMALTPEDSDGG